MYPIADFGATDYTHRRIGAFK